MLANDIAQAILADIGKKTKPIPVINRVIEVDVVPMIIILSTDYKTVFRIFISLWYVVFVFEVCDHHFNVVDLVIKTVNIVYFFSNLCSRSSFSNGAFGYNVSVFWSIYYIKLRQICQDRDLCPCDRN